MIRNFVARPIVTFIFICNFLFCIYAGLYFIDGVKAKNLYILLDRAKSGRLKVSTGSNMLTTYIPLNVTENNEGCNADYWEGVGDILEYQPTPLARSSRAVAYSKAISCEPAKAKFWAKLAHVKALNYEFDETFYLAFERAYEYGAEEYFIDQSLAHIGLAYWYPIKVELRVLLKEIIINLYQADQYQTLALAGSYGQMGLACIWVVGVGEVNPLCERDYSKRIKGYSYN